jgi:hypothetical protein
VFLKLKKLGAIKLFITKLEKCADLPEAETKKINIGKIIFNCRVALFLMCQEANSQKQIFKLKGMEHIIALLKHSPKEISDQLRFSKILLNFSLETPNSRIGSTFSAFVAPFFFLLSEVIEKELKLYLYNKDLFYEDILKQNNEDSDEEIEDNKSDTRSYRSRSTKQLKDLNVSYYSQTRTSRGRGQDSKFQKFQKKVEEAFVFLTERRKSMMGNRGVDIDEEEVKTEKEIKFNQKQKESLIENQDAYNSIEENILNCLCRISLQRESQPIIFKVKYIHKLIDFIELSVDQLNEIKCLKGSLIL